MTKYTGETAGLKVELLNHPVIGFVMRANNRELCPHCIDLMEVTVEKKIVREDEISFVEKAIHYCCGCNNELVKTVTLKFKHRMG
ncbi:MAG: hypothetical protein PHU23_02945 [Dehalococcoidales bacterium]|nr:hypothetical protein [Dehalococcoidales bacterium]